MPTSQGRLFLYGTLLDRELRAAVIGTGPQEPVPATLRGFRRVRLAGTPYPTLRPTTGAAVNGLFLGGLTPASLDRLAVYEGQAYRLIRCTVSVSDRRFAARVFTAAPSRATTEIWSFDAWAACQRRRDIASGRAEL